MPYIEKKHRDRLDPLHPDWDDRINTPGELNYLFTDFCTKYLKAHGLNYTSINDILGALEGAKLEFYRRVAVPYEETKLLSNGDVYDSK